MGTVDSGAVEAFEREFSDWVEAAANEHRFRFFQAATGCESPIEQRLLASLAYIECPFERRADRRPLLWWAGDQPADDDVLLRIRDEFFTIYPQVQVLSYRADFLLLARFLLRDTILKIVIECDGHNFHERTKEQAQHDRERDRRMTAAGYKVFRFTGSEIFRRARRCAGEIEGYLKEEYQRTAGR